MNVGSGKNWKLQYFQKRRKAIKKPHSLGSGVKSHNPSPLEARRD